MSAASLWVTQTDCFIAEAGQLVADNAKQIARNVNTRYSETGARSQARFLCAQSSVGARATAEVVTWHAAVDTLRGSLRGDAGPSVCFTCRFACVNTECPQQVCTTDTSRTADDRYPVLARHGTSTSYHNPDVRLTGKLFIRHLLVIEQPASDRHFSVLRSRIFISA